MQQIRGVASKDTRLFIGWLIIYFDKSFMFFLSDDVTLLNRQYAPTENKKKKKKKQTKKNKKKRYEN